MRNKKFIIPALVAVVALAAGAVYVPVSRGATDMPIFGTTTVLGINLLMGNSGGAKSVMTFVDFSAASTTDQNYTLPTVVGKSGQIVIVKGINAEQGMAFVNVYPASGETLDNKPEREYAQTPGYGPATLMLIADPSHGTWWTVSTN